MTDGMKDGATFASLGSAVVWAPVLSHVNQLLTTVALLLTIVAALWRGWAWFRSRRKGEPET